MVARLDTVATLDAGMLRGKAGEAVTSWLGVPFAQPPIGPLRFRPPAPVASWSGIRSAERLAGAAAQSGFLGRPGQGLGSGVGEDCLYLNVYAPVAAVTDGPGRPVLVWIHGGAYTSGSGALYDGRSLAELGDIVVVTVNYRLGVFGFVDLASAVDADVAPNLGIQDQIAALVWVQGNIAAFGGDPDQVSVAGESAGSVSVSLLTCAPAARGLFRAAIMESGSYSLIHGPQVSQEIARSYARQLGLGPRDGHRLWTLPVAQLLAAQVAVNRWTRGTVPASPWFDGDVVPSSLEAAQAGVRPDLALLTGHNRDEVTLFQRKPGEILPTRRHDLSVRLRAGLGWDQAETVLDQYPETAAGTRALGTDLNFAMPTQHFAARHSRAGGRTFCYRFDAAVPVLGATHASELVYVWQWSGLTALVLAGRSTPQRRALGSRMRQHWVSFVRHGSPGPDWPAYELPGRAVKIFDPVGDRVEPDPSRVRRLAWADQDVMPRG